MATLTALPARKTRRAGRLQTDDWLVRLLMDIHKQIATHPSPRAIERIRQRVFAEMDTPARAAA